LGRDYRKIIENAVRISGQILRIRLLNCWGGKRSEEKLKEILAQDKSQELLKNLEVIEKEVDVTNDEQKQLKSMFRESLTFD
jgi:hypothetical protein